MAVEAGRYICVGELMRGVLAEAMPGTDDARGGDAEAPCDMAILDAAGEFPLFNPLATVVADPGRGDMALPCRWAGDGLATLLRGDANPVITAEL